MRKSPPPLPRPAVAVPDPSPPAPRVGAALAGIVLVGAALRVVAALNAGDSADSMHFITHAVRFLRAGRLETYDQSSGLWYAVTSLFYEGLGVTPFASRLASLLFGTMSIPVMFLLAREFFDDVRVARFAALLLAVAPFHVMQTAAEMDVMAMFFVLSSMLFFVRGLRRGRAGDAAASGVLLGLAIATKVYPVLFLPSYLLLALVAARRPGGGRGMAANLRSFALLAGCALVFLIPTMVHNLLLYRDQGLLDFTFTRVLNQRTALASHYYEYDPLYRARNDWLGLFTGHSANGGGDPAPLLLIVVGAVGRASPLITLAGVTGLVWLAFDRGRARGYVAFFLSSIAFVLPFLASLLPLPKHFVFLEALLTPAAGWTLARAERGASRWLRRDLGWAFAAASLLVTLLWLGRPLPGTFGRFYASGFITRTIAYQRSHIPPGALIVADDRIYDGYRTWMLYGRPSLEASRFWDLYRRQEGMAGDVALTDVYYLECARADCGWGEVRVRNKPVVLMQAMTAAFGREGERVAVIRDPPPDGAYYPVVSRGGEQEAIRVYRKRMPLKAAIVALASQPKEWFQYTIGYPADVRSFDDYTVNGAGEAVLDRGAHLVLYLAVALAFLSPVFVLSLLRTGSAAS